MVKALARVLILLCIALTAIGVTLWLLGRMEIGVGDVGGEKWQIRGLRLAIDWQNPPAIRLQANATALSLPVIGDITDISIDCPSLKVAQEKLTCAMGTGTVADDRFAAREFNYDFEYFFTEDIINLAVRDIPLGETGATLDGAFGPDSWRVTLAGKNTGVQTIGELFRDVIELPPLTGSGQLDFQTQMNGGDDGLEKLDLQATIQSRDLATVDSRFATANLRTAIQVELTGADEDFLVNLKMNLPKGQLYWDPVFVEAGRRPVSLAAQGRWALDQDRLRLEHFRLIHPGVADLRASGDVILAPELSLDTVSIQGLAATLPGFYQTYANPYLIGTVLDNLETKGRVNMTGRLRRLRPVSLRLQFRDVEITDRDARFAVTDLAGNWYWGRQQKVKPSRVSWRSGRFYGIDIGVAELDAIHRKASIRLRKQARIPVLDGTVIVDHLDADNLGGNKTRWALKGSVTPISMGRLTKALGWVPMGGKLSSTIPAVRYADGVMSTTGELKINAFDGVTIVRDLRMREPLGLVPRLQANVELRGLDLKSLTQTFSFGRIEGRLDGNIKDLRLQNWRPVAFDADFYTPPGDRSRRRISQQAVNHLARLTGGGMSDVLSRGALGMFKNFGYSKLRLRCRLARGVCDMEGVAPAENGFYIVKGGGLPRIDVIGYTRRVDWNDLVTKLKRVTREGAARVE